MNELAVFNNPEFGEIRTVTINGEPWFVGKDIADILGYKDTVNALKQHVEDEDKINGMQNTTPYIIDSMGRAQYPTWINESGLYDLVFGSHLPNAKRFKRWVTSEVLPSIRKTGTYSIENTKQDSYTIDDPVERAKRWIEEQEEKKLLQNKISELEPKAKLCDDILDAKLLVNFRDAA